MLPYIYPQRTHWPREIYTVERISSRTSIVGVEEPIILLEFLPVNICLVIKNQPCETFFFFRPSGTLWLPKSTDQYNLKKKKKEHPEAGKSTLLSNY